MYKKLINTYISLLFDYFPFFDVKKKKFNGCLAALDR